MKRYLLYIVLTVVLSTAGCTRGQWLDEIETKRDEQATVVPILLDAYDKGLLVTSVKVVERTDKYLHHSEYDHRYRLTFYDDTVVEIEIGHPSDDKFYEKRGQAYIREILTSGERGVEFYVWLPNEEWRQKYNHLVCEDGETVRFYLRIRDDDVLSKIYYTSTDGEIVTPNNKDVFGSNMEGYEAIIVSNTYENGQGVITFVGNVTKIGDSAFTGCSSLTSITIPDSVTSIGDYAFYGCSSLTSITIPEGVTSIGFAAFRGCSSLASVYCKAITPPTAIPKYASIWDAFDDNASGRKIYVPTESVEAYKTAEYWSNYADAFVAYDFEKGEEVNLESRKIYYTSTDGNVVTPYATNVFGANIVSNTYADGQGVITFDGNVTTIGGQAFDDCLTLASITIPEGVTSIGYQAFYGCSSLASVTLPDSVTEIGGQAFYGCTALTSVTIPDGVTSIGSYVFAGCSGLTEFKGQLVSDDGRCLIINGAIHSFAPAGLTGYAIPEGVTSIVATAFYGCASLISITIPDSVTYIGEWAFKDCLSLTSVYCMPTTPPTGGTGRFDNGVVGRKIYVPAESIEAYKSANYWSDYADDFVAYDFVKGEEVNLENRKIYYTSTDGNVVTPNRSGTSDFGAHIVSNTYENGQGVITFDGEVTLIGYAAFHSCTSLASITIPEGVTSIGRQAFQGCSSLASLTIPDSVTEIRGFAFDGCSSLASVTIPDSVTSIGNDAFRYCSSLASITIPEGVTSIGISAFRDCSSLTSITIPDSVTEISGSAFSGCLFTKETFINNSSLDAETNNYWGAKVYDIIQEDGLCINGTIAVDCRDKATSVTIPDSVTSIGDSAFRDCSSLTSVTIPDSVTSIGGYAFYGCKSLTSITIPDSVTSIRYYAFYDCSSLASVYCKAITPPTAILDALSRWNAFNSNASGCKIYVPEESVEAYKTAEWWSEYADAIEPYVFE